MEQLDVFDCSNVLIASYFTDDRGCAHENREHTLIYLCSGELEIEERGKKTVLHPEIVPLCGVTTGCGYRKKSETINLTVLSC